MNYIFYEIHFLIMNNTGKNITFARQKMYLLTNPYIKS